MAIHDYINKNISKTEEGVHVVAAIIELDDKVLICQRPQNKSDGGLWEFPGGKIEKKESPEEALIRECKEELSVSITIEGLYHQWAGIGEDGPLLISFYKAELTDDKALDLSTLLEHQQALFVYPAQLEAYALCQADSEAAELLMAQPGPRPIKTHMVWDFDGTLFDSYKRVTRAMQQALAEQGHMESDEYIFKLVKRSVGYAISTLEEKYEPANPLLPRYKYYEDNLPESDGDMAPHPGIEDLLASLAQAGVKHYVYTHRGGSTKEHLYKAQLDIYFSDIITSEDGFPGKPAPDALMALMTRHNIKPKNALMIGDRDIDMISANNAGIMGCLFDPDHIYDDFETPIRTDSVPGLGAILWSKRE